MGRGRAKAKQTKVARELKYRSFETDFSSLAQELRTGTEGHEVPRRTPTWPKSTSRTMIITLRQSLSTDTFASRGSKSPIEPVGALAWTP